MQTANHVIEYLHSAVSERLQETVFKDIETGVGEYLTDGRRIARLEGFGLNYRLRDGAKQTVVFGRDIDAIPVLLIRLTVIVRGVTEWASSVQRVTDFERWKPINTDDQLLAKTLSDIDAGKNPSKVSKPIFNQQLTRFSAYCGDGEAP